MYEELEENKLGKNIKKYRMMNGWTQKELGERLLPSVQNSAINKWECGLVTNIRRDHIEQMARLFGISVPVLEGYDDRNPIYFENSENSTENSKVPKPAQVDYVDPNNQFIFFEAQKYAGQLKGEQLERLKTYIEYLQHSGGSN